MTKRKKAYAAAAVLCALMLWGACFAYADAAAGLPAVLSAVFNSSQAAGILRQTPLVLLDPGHGGIDGGAESAAGECEKNINLDICLKIRDILEENGVKTEMTRESDCGLYTEGKGSIRSKKTEDLHARLKMSYDLEPDAFVSIHLNSYREDRSVYGAQTFYTTSCDTETAEKSRVLAEKIQELFIEYIGNGNTRTAMKKNDVLLLREARVPTVIAECGFLSNAEEAALLQTEKYRGAAARAVADGIMSFLGVEKKDKSQSQGGIKVIVSS